jgi:hypothetical protein
MLECVVLADILPRSSPVFTALANALLKLVRLACVWLMCTRGTVCVYLLTSLCVCSKGELLRALTPVPLPDAMSATSTSSSSSSSAGMSAHSVLLMVRQRVCVSVNVCDLACRTHDAGCGRSRAATAVDAAARVGVCRQ